MKKFCVFSGFHGSGKTTTMIALTKYYREKHGKAAMISNDLGHGVNLADHRLALLSACDASEMTDECICFQNENLADRLDSYYADGYNLVISDIPGFGVGALDHVYHGLNEKYPGVYDLAPFTVLTEPNTVELLRSGNSGDLEYILHTQLVEADLIVLNKCDTIEASQVTKDTEWLKAHYPLADVIAISAVTGAGLEELSMALKEKQASMRRPDVNFPGPDSMNPICRFSEYYLQYHVSVCCNTFDGDAYLLDMAEQMQEKMQSEDSEVPHLKLLAWDAEGDYGKVDLIGNGRPIVETRKFRNPCIDLAVILNANAVCDGDRFRELMMDTIKRISEKYQLEIMIFKEEWLNLGM